MRFTSARSLAVGAALASATLAPLPAYAQASGRSGAPSRASAGSGGGGASLQGAPYGVPRGVLGGLPMTAEDSVIKTITSRLDFASYKSLIKGLTQFGDREQGTERNAKAVDWIEQQLRSWGYTTERVKYMYTPRNATPSPREEVFATKVGATTPQEMYIISGHTDGRGGGEAANDDGSGTALVMEIARVLSAPDIETNRSIRFALWNNEETGLDGARAYLAQRSPLQGIESPPRSGKYPEPRWLGVIQHDMMMWDHGNPVQWVQALDADVDIEFQLNSAKAAESAALALSLLNANRMFATDYPAAMSNSMSNTDSAPFQDLVASISLRENRRLYETGRGANPTWHESDDLYATYSDLDFRLGFNAAQTTLGGIARLAGVRLTTH